MQTLKGKKNKVKLSGLLNHTKVFALIPVESLLSEEVFFFCHQVNKKLRLLSHPPLWCKTSDDLRIP